MGTTLHSCAVYHFLTLLRIPGPLSDIHKTSIHLETNPLEPICIRCEALGGTSQIIGLGQKYLLSMLLPVK